MDLLDLNVANITFILGTSLVTLLVSALFHKYYLKQRVQPKYSILLLEYIHCACYSVVVFGLACYSFYELYSTPDLRFNGRTSTSILTLCVHTSYFINDVLFLLYMNQGDQAFDRYLHHGIILLCNIKTLYFGIGHFHVMCFDLSELTNIFFSYVLCVKEFEFPQTKLYYASLVLFSVTFIIFRVIGFGLVCWLYMVEVAWIPKRRKLMHGADFEFSMQGERFMWYLQLYWLFVYRDIIQKEYFAAVKSN